jgi:surface antigen
MRFVLAVVLAAISTAAAAQFVGLLKGGPAELFDDADLRLFLDTANQALEAKAGGAPLAWQNPKSGHRGDMTVLREFESKGRECKQVRVRNEANTRKSDMRHNLCKVDGRWRLVGDIKTGEKK